MINQWIETLSLYIQDTIWLAPIIALLAGALTSLTPCSLATIPLIVGYVGGTADEPKKAFKFSMIFAIGSAVTFTALGVIASIAGSLIGSGASWWYLVIGVLMILMALQTWELFQFIPSTNILSKSKKKGLVGAFLAGILGGIFASPCATPMLIVLLALVAGKGSVVWGVALLLIYSIGHGALAVVAGTSVGLVTKISTDEKYGKLSKVIKIVMGLLILLIGLYLIYLGL